MTPENDCSSNACQEITQVLWPDKIKSYCFPFIPFLFLSFSVLRPLQVPPGERAPNPIYATSMFSLCLMLFIAFRPDPQHRNIICVAMSWTINWGKNKYTVFMTNSICIYNIMYIIWNYNSVISFKRANIFIW